MQFMPVYSIGGFNIEPLDLFGSSWLANPVSDPSPECREQTARPFNLGLPLVGICIKLTI